MNETGFVMFPGWLRRRKPSGNAVLVYLSLAAHGTFNPGTGCYEECRPSIPTVAEDTQLSETTVRKGIKDLIKLGGLIAGPVRRGPDGGELPRVYRVVFGALTPPAESEGGVVQKDTPGGVPKSEGNQEPPTKNPSALQRGTRLPDDWKPSDALLQWFVSEFVDGERWNPESREACRREHAKFADYWKAAAGKSATKRDWDAAWRFWMRNAFNGRGYERRRTAGAGPAGQPQTFKQMDRADEQVKLDRARMIDAALAHIQEKCPEMEWQAAFDLARQEVDNHLAGHPNGLSGSSATGYIEAEVIEPDADVKEVTGP